MVAFVQRVRIIFYLWSISLCGAVGFCAPVRADKLRLTPETLAVADQIYSGDLEGGRVAALRLQEEQPDHPIGYLLEAEALWWKIWCSSAEFKYGMTYPRHRAKLAADRHYLELAAKPLRSRKQRSRSTIPRRCSFTQAWATRWLRDCMDCAARGATRRGRGCARATICYARWR